MFAVADVSLAVVSVRQVAVVVADHADLHTRSRLDRRSAFPTCGGASASMTSRTHSVMPHTSIKGSPDPRFELGVPLRMGALAPIPGFGYGDF